MKEQEDKSFTRLRMLGAGFLRWFGRPGVTLTIIIVLLVLYFLGLVIPQKPFFESRAHYEGWLSSHQVLGPVFDNLGFTDIYTSPVTLFFLLLFYLNLALVVSRRVPYVLKKAMVAGRDEALAFDAGDLKRSGRSHEIILGDIEPRKAQERIKSFFRRRAWFVRQSETGERTLAVRNRLSSLGFLLFHVSFLLCLTGGLMIYYTRFSGNIALTEGEAFRGDLKQFYSVQRQPKIMRGMQPLAFRLEKATTSYEQKQASSLDAVFRMKYKDDESVEHIGVNQPVRRGAYTILAVNLGGSPLFVLRDAETGAEYDGAWVRLDATEELADMFRFDEAPGLDFYALFFPDYMEKDGEEKSRSLNIVNPAYHVTVKHRGAVIANATIKKGQAMVFEPFMLEFRDLRHWVDFKVVREIGSGPLIVGFCLAVVGLVMRLIFYRREIRVALEEDRIWVVGRSEYYSHSFEAEMDGFVDDLRRYVLGIDKQGADGKP